MSELSEDQISRRASIQKGAMIWGVIAGGVVGLVALWLLGGQGAVLRYGGAAVAGLAVGFLAFRGSFNSGAKSARCEKCGAAFSRSRTDRKETLKSSAPKSQREEQPDKSVKVTTWDEDTFDVVDTYTCAKCSDTTTKAYTTTRRRDEKTVVEPYAPPKQAAAGKTGSWGAGKASDDTKNRKG